MLARCLEGAHETRFGVLVRGSAGFPCQHFSGGCPSRLGFPELAVRFFPSWRAGKRIRGIPKGREEEDSRAFQPCGAVFKTELFIQALASVAERQPRFPLFKPLNLKEKKMGKKAARRLALSAACAPQPPSRAKPAGSRPPARSPFSQRTPWGERAEQARYEHRCGLGPKKGVFPSGQGK